MFFKRKYVFETKKTKFIRDVINISICILCLFFVYSTACVVLIIDARNEANEAKTHFVQTPPDLIAVFTGGPKRIESAVLASKAFNQPNVFITGVYEKNSVKTLVGQIDQGQGEEATDYIELDYTARNTVENVIATLKYLRSTRGFNNVLIVSSDYHIMRIKMIISSLRLENDHYNFFFAPVMSDYTNVRNLKIIYTEVFKLLRTKIFLILWDQKAPIGHIVL